RRRRRAPLFRRRSRSDGASACAGLQARPGRRAHLRSCRVGGGGAAGAGRHDRAGDRRPLPRARAALAEAQRAGAADPGAGPALRSARVDARGSGAGDDGERERPVSISDPGGVMKITSVLYVDAIEPGLEFWVGRMGFEKTVEVPHEDKLGFVILVKDGTELMLQSWASVAADDPSFLGNPRGHSSVLFIEVDDFEDTKKRLAGTEVV